MEKVLRLSTGTIVDATDLPVHDSRAFDELLHGDEEVIDGDKAYADSEKEAEFTESGGARRVV